MSPETLQLFNILSNISSNEASNLTLPPTFSDKNIIFDSDDSVEDADFVTNARSSISSQKERKSQDD
jgi:hypothetical protein